MTTEAPDPQRVREALAEATGDDPGALELSPIEGGASRQTFLVSAGGEPRWVVRREPAAGMSFNSLEVELGAVKAADLAGVAVAPTVWFEPAGGRFGAGAAYAMEFVLGTSVAPRVLRRDELAIARERLPVNSRPRSPRPTRSSPAPSRGSPAAPPIRRSRRATCGRRSWTQSASPCRRSRLGCAGCA